MNSINYKLLVSYDGTAYCGWQLQNDVPTVQGIIEEKLKILFSENIRIRFASRTDAGVHALEQVVSFSTAKEKPIEVVQKALNSLLPEDVVILSVEQASKEFDARKATKKTYKYVIRNHKLRDPLSLNRSWWFPYKLDFGVMEEAAKLFIGLHDFNAFMCVGSDVKTTERNVYNIVLTKESDVITLRVTANGFLKQMVRNLVGTLVDVGRGYMKADDIKKLLNGSEEVKRGITAPAHGLYLEKVYYEG